MIDQIIANIKEYLKSNEIPDLDQETILEFKGIPHAEIGFDRDNLDIPNKKLGIYLNLEIEDEEELYNRRFELLPLLEEILIKFYNETYNDDPCSFQYEYKHRTEMDNNRELVVTCTDYLS